MKKQHQENTKESLITTLQTIIKQDVLSVDFNGDAKNNFFSWNQNLIDENKNIILPEVSEKINYSRASFDMAACYFLFHDSKIYKQKEVSFEEKDFFDSFEKIRVLDCISKSYRGILKNILHKVESDIFSASSSLSLVLLKELFPKEVLPKTKEIALEIESNLSKKVIQEIKKLKLRTNNQKDFQDALENLLELIKREEEVDDSEKEEQSLQQENNNQDQQKELHNFSAENSPDANESNFNQNGEELEKKEVNEIEANPKIKEEEDLQGEINLKSQKTESKETKIEFKNSYKIYSSKFDEVIFPQKIISKNDLELLRDQLDLRLSKLSGISKKMSLKLKRKLISRKNALVEFDVVQGVLNRKKLSRIVIDPFVEDVWVNNKDHQYNDTALTILLDNSGSMRGNPIVMSAMTCEIIAEILEKFSVKTEIIGFTTADWKGGRVRKLWESSGRIKNPGRLNELRHIIYKHFNQSFKKSKINL
ncbi:MAG: hypothetical protein FJ368_01980, partial [Pelagibacterales bacterium]|nr:hypothetical protein [Pelagibacterales bacterium]